VTKSIIGGHFPLPEMGLVHFTSLKSESVAMLDTLFFNKIKKQIVRQMQKNLKLVGIPELTITIETHVLRGIDKGPVATVSTNVHCTQVTKVNILKIFKEIEDYEIDLFFLKTQVAQLEGDLTNLF
jgi:hypothetical protein